MVKSGLNAKRKKTLSDFILVSSTPPSPFRKKSDRLHASSCYRDIETFWSNFSFLVLVVFPCGNYSSYFYYWSSRNLCFFWQGLFTISYLEKTIVSYYLFVSSIQYFSTYSYTQIYEYYMATDYWKLFIVLFLHIFPSWTIRKLISFDL